MVHQALANELTDSTTLVMAPTGTAALNVDGYTLHNAAGLPIRQQYHNINEQLNSRRLAHFRIIYKNVKVIIIDEISMTSIDQLYQLSSRLNLIFGVRAGRVYFGGRLLVAMGDLYQLPPIGAEPVFGSPHANTNVSALGPHIWKDNFILSELTIVERQKGDSIFKDLLNRIREAKHTMVDIALLETRLLTRLGLTPDADEIWDLPFLYQTNDDVDKHNKRRTDQLEQRLLSSGQPADVLQQTAVDIITNLQKESIGREPFIRKEVAGLKTAKTAGVPHHFKLLPGTRVMMVKNDPKNNIANGSSGTIAGWSSRLRPDGLAEYILVRFLPCKGKEIGRKLRAKLPASETPEDPNVVPIFPTNTYFTHGAHNINRLFFTMKIAWAMTIHKVRHLSF